MSTEISRERIEQLIAAETETLDRVVRFIRDGQRAGRITDESAELLVGMAQHEHNGAVRLLRELLDEDE
jgi:hypothetical protein